MIDTHCHLTDPRLHSQLADVINRAFAANVRRMITIGTDLADDRAAVALCDGRDFLRCAVGIHPNESQDAKVEDVTQLDEIQKHASVVALGEMGLDYHYDRAERMHQAEIFTQQLKLAERVGRPVVIHCREAVDDTLAILKTCPTVPAVFHCFTGTPEEAQKIIDAGYFLGFTGAVTFKKNDALREAARLTPKDRIFVETDAPYLSPEPHRSQKTNEPALVIYTAAVVARVKGLSLEELDAITTENAEKFFGLSIGNRKSEAGDS
jgi:TatD DNase family protein